MSIATPEWIAEQLATANRHFEPLAVAAEDGARERRIMTMHY